MATKLKLLVSQGPMVLLELVHLLPCVDLALLDLVCADLPIDGLAQAALVGGSRVILLLLLYELGLVLLVLGSAAGKKLLLLLLHVG